MKRAIFVVLCLCLASVAASASYRLFLVNGKVLVVDAKPTVEGGKVRFSQGAVEYTLDLSEVDLPRSERENAVSPPPAEPEKGPAGPKKPVRYTDEDIERLKEGGSRPGMAMGPDDQGGPAGEPPGEAGAPESRPKADGDRVEKLYERKESLERERRSLTEKAADLQSKLDAFDRENKDKDYQFSRESTNASHQEQYRKWKADQDSRRGRIEKDLATTQARLSRVQENLKDVHDRILKAYEK
jgi:hypothetical protein